VTTHFRGWAKPGPVPPGTEGDIEVPPGESLDALSGHFRIYQLRAGHRFSTDDVLTAWYGTTWVPSARTVLDLGIRYRVSRDDRRLAIDRRSLRDCGSSGR
jgi:hypothetical protein